MAQVSLTINGRAYQVACDDGQEGHLQKLAEHLDDKVQGIADQAGSVGERRRTGAPRPRAPRRPSSSTTAPAGSKLLPPASGRLR